MIIDTDKIKKRLFFDDTVKRRILRDYGIDSEPENPDEFMAKVIDKLNQKPAEQPMEKSFINKDIFRAAVKAIGSNNRAWVTFIRNEWELASLLNDYDPKYSHEAFEQGHISLEDLKKYLPGQSSTADAKAIQSWARLLTEVENYYDYIRELGVGFRRKAELPDSELLLCIVGYLGAPLAARVANVADRHLSPYYRKLPGMGYILASEFMRNLGWNGFKPDRHIQRLFNRWFPDIRDRVSQKVQHLLKLQQRKDKNLKTFFTYSLIGVAISPPNVPISIVDNMVWLLGAYKEKKGKETDISYVVNFYYSTNPDGYEVYYALRDLFEPGRDLPLQD